MCIFKFNWEIWIAIWDTAVLAKLKKFTAEVFLQCFRQMRQLEKMISTRLEESWTKNIESQISISRWRSYQLF